SHTGALVIPASRVVLLAVRKDMLDVIRVRELMEHQRAYPEPEDVPEPPPPIEQEAQRVRPHPGRDPDRQRKPLANPRGRRPRDRCCHGSTLRRSLPSPPTSREFSGRVQYKWSL